MGKKGKGKGVMESEGKRGRKRNGQIITKIHSGKINSPQPSSQHYTHTLFTHLHIPHTHTATSANVMVVQSLHGDHQRRPGRFLQSCTSSKPKGKHPYMYAHMHKLKGRWEKAQEAKKEKEK
jgi:hypothetical protein